MSGFSGSSFCARNLSGVPGQIWSILD